ncbi:MAG: ATP-binding protein [Candidatus Komeilibacteria bacterium]|nr:ATP-binding protein [Candidatus Komeilibacteria bacterium]
MSKSTISSRFTTTVLKSTEKILRGLLNSMNEPFLVANKKGEVEYINNDAEIFLQSLGVKVDKLTLERLFRLFNFVDNDYFYYWQELWQKKISYFTICQGKCDTYYEVRLSTMQTKPLPLVVLVRLRDVTESMIEHLDNRRVSDFNAQVLETVPDSIIVLDKDGNIILANKEYYKSIEYSSTDVIGTNLFKTDLFLAHHTLHGRFKKLLHDGTPVQIEKISYPSKLAHKNFYLAIKAVPLRSKVGDVIGALSIARDITELEEAYLKLEELNRNLEAVIAERTNALKRTNEELARAIRVKDDFMSDASHELRTPLTIIRGNIELAIRSLKGQMPEELHTIMAEVNRMTAILRDITFLVREPQVEQRLEPAKFSLDETIQGMLMGLKILAQQKNVYLFSELKYGDVIEADESKVEKLIYNLVVNAIKYNRRSGWVKVNTYANNGHAKIVVEDSGIGISEDKLPHIFNRFYRVDRARSRQQGGSGLGLAIAKTVVDLHGGKIEVFSEENKGTRFVITLPRKQGNTKSEQKSLV